MKHRPTSFHSTTLVTYSARRDIRHLDGLLRRAACKLPILRSWSMAVLVNPPVIWLLLQELGDKACNVAQFRLLYKELLHLSILESYKPRQTNDLDRNSYGQLYCTAFDCTYIYTLGAACACNMVSAYVRTYVRSRTFVDHSRTLVAHSLPLCGS